MNLDEISIEIVDDLLDSTNEVHVTGIENNVSNLIYKPLNNDD